MRKAQLVQQVRKAYLGYKALLAQPGRKVLKVFKALLAQLVQLVHRARTVLFQDRLAQLVRKVFKV